MARENKESLLFAGVKAPSGGHARTPPCVVNIGLNAHAATCTLAVVGPSGRRLDSQVVETNGSALISALKSIPGPRHLCLAEGTQSAWLYEVLNPVVSELVLAQQTRRSQGNKNDKLDPYGLTTALLKDTLPRRVYKAPRRFAKLRTLAHGYTTDTQRSAET